MSGLSRRKILDAILRSNNPALMAFGERLMKGEFELDEAPKKSCETCGHRSPFGLSRICLCCKDHTLWGGFSVKGPNPESHDDRMDTMQYSINSLDCERRRHVTSINILDKKVEEIQKKHANSDQVIDKRLSALEDQHGDIPPDPEKSTCIDLGPPFGKIYVLKQIKCKERKG